MSTPPILPKGRGGLFRSLLWPMLALVAAVGVMGSIWAHWVRVTEEREHLLETLRGNAAMVERMNLRVSESMADNLSTAMGWPVAFVSEDGEVQGGASWSAGDRELALRAVNAEKGNFLEGKVEVISVKVSERRGHLVILHESSNSWLEWRDWRSWGLFFTVLPLGTIVAFLLARKLARPLEGLALQAPDFHHCKLPAALMLRSDEIGTLARALDTARDKILEEQQRRETSERLAMLGQIATGLAHEIKNPAAAILMQAELMGEQSGALMIREEAEEITALVNQWLFIAKPSPPRVQQHDLVAAIEDLIKRRGLVLGYYGVIVNFEAPARAEYLCDLPRLMQAVRNLIDNGVAAMPLGGGITLSLRREHDRLQLEVADSGAGFSKRAFERFGEPFFSEKEGGMGLGLALVRGVVEAHGGSVTAHNVEQGGVVVLSLPLDETNNN